jgi:hypothetical protein
VIALGDLLIGFTNALGPVGGKRRGSPKFRRDSLFVVVSLIHSFCGEQFNNNAEVIFAARLRRLTAD